MEVLRIPPSSFSQQNRREGSSGFKLMIRNMDLLLSGCSPCPHKRQRPTVKFLVAVQAVQGLKLAAESAVQGLVSWSEIQSWHGLPTASGAWEMLLP